MYALNKQIIFDQYSRYKVCADSLTNLGITKGTILDVGSGEECLLGQFLPDFDITYLDPLLQNNESEKKIHSDIFSTTFTQKFDWIFCIDTLEHVPPEKRSDFLKILSNLSLKGMIIAGPCSDKGDAINTDKWVDETYFQAFGSDYKWLEEHFKNSLPKLSFIKESLDNLDWKISVIENGHTPWMRDFLSFSICAIEFENGLQKVLELSDYFNKNLYQFDHQPPCYRQVVIATKTQPTITINQKLDAQKLSESNKLWNVLQRQLSIAFVDLLNKNNNVIVQLRNDLNKAINDVDVLQELNIRHSELISKQDSQLSNLQTTLKNKDSQLSILKNNNTLESEIEVLQESLQIKQKEIIDLRKAIESYQKIITDIHQSFVLRALHKYDKTLGKYIPIRPKKYAKSTNEHSTAEDQKQTLNTLSFRKDRKDILCFPIINWDFRYQRPQHLISKFVEQGHRVFYFTVNLRKLTRPYEIKNLEKNLYQVEINSPHFFDIYKDRFDNSLLTKILESFEIFKNDVSLDAVSFVQFPTWYPLVSKLKRKYDFPIIFDCLDDFTGFSNVQKEREKEELSLISESSLVTASSSYLLKKVMKKTSNCIFLPNAGQFEHFNKKPSENLVDIYSKPIIGYFGAISDWFDNKLIEFLASKKPNYTFVLIGHTYGSDITKLEKFKNVHFLGERPYSELPKYLHGFDVCLIPFKNVPLIEATHPVKIYEYLAAGKPVVATKMLELLPIKDLCYIANTHEEFLSMLEQALQEKSQDLIEKRIAYASKNTWTSRFESLYSKLTTLDSVVLNQHN